MKSPAFFFALLLGNLQLTAQCLSLSNCPIPSQTVCDSSLNDAQFWNEQNWYDPKLSSHNLAEAPTEISMSIVDSCGGDVQVSFVLLLDLNDDGARETAISSLALPGADTVYFGNAFNPNYGGGTAYHFDERPVPGNQKYVFALEKTVQGNLTTARLRWTTPLAPNDYVQPQLPLGRHRIEWRFEKQGEVKTCGYDFTVKDCAAPTVVCLNGLSVNIMPTMMIQLWATDFLQYAEDNISPTNQVEIGIRRAGAGTGFPVDANGDPTPSVLFTCMDLGTQHVELWARDAAGNARFCETYVLVQDNLQNCEQGSGAYQVCAKSACSNFTQGIEGVTFELSGSSPAVPPFSIFGLADGDGCINFDFPFPFANSLKISAEKDENPLNGASTYDLVLLAKHINGTQPFTENWQWVAADTDLNGSIDSNDLVNCRSIVLGKDSLLPYPGLRFYPLNFAFPAGNPLALPIPNYIILDSTALSAPIEFAAVKTCDFNCNGIITGIEETIPAAGSIGQPQPNPTATGMSVPLFLQKSAAVAVEILDLTGRSLYRTTATYSAGEQRLDVPASAFPQAGLYLWRVQAGAEFRTGKIVKQ